MGYNLGIDFGTSTVKVALRQGNEIPFALPIGNKGDMFMPSVVAYRRTKNDMAQPMAIGEDAMEVPETDDTHVVSESKRCLTASQFLGKLPQERYPWWDSDNRCVRLWSARFSPHDVVLTILNEALERAVRLIRESGLGIDVDKFTIRGLPTRLGCSVTADLQTRRILSEVARRSGFPEFKVNDLWEEPILALLSYAHLEQVVPGETIVVYDLGGGTFDTAVVKVHEESGSGAPALTVFSADGEPFCGGADIDEALFEHLILRLAEEYRGFKGEERLQILSLMSPDEKQKLRNRAREAKETLSEAEETTITLPSGFLGEAEGMLTVGRNELETIVKKTRLVDKTLNCVLRAWRRARMLLRNPGEAVGTFYLEYDSSSGKIDGSVLNLRHQDLKKNVNRVLIVGGATRMPLIRQCLASLWDTHKLISEDVVKPVEASSIGAAWQQEEVRAIVDRLPFSVILCYDASELELYPAFTPTVSYKTLTASPSINPFRSAPFTLPSSCREVVIVLRNTDGDIIEKHPLSNIPRGRCLLEIDAFGRCVIKTDLGTPIEQLPNPFQHPLQKELWERVEEERQKKEEEKREQIDRYLKRLPGEDLYEVG